MSNDKVIHSSVSCPLSAGILRSPVQALLRSCSTPCIAKSHDVSQLSDLRCSTKQQYLAPGNSFTVQMQQSNTVHLVYITFVWAVFLFFEPAVTIYPVTLTEIGSRFSLGCDIPQGRDVPHQNLCSDCLSRWRSSVRSAITPVSEIRSCTDRLAVVLLCEPMADRSQWSRL